MADSMVSWCSNYDEGMHVVFSGKAWHHIVLVSPYALYEIGCDTHIQGFVSAAGQKIDARLHNSRSIQDSGLRRNDEAVCNCALETDQIPHEMTKSHKSIGIALRGLFYAPWPVFVGIPSVDPLTSAGDEEPVQQGAGDETADMGPPCDPSCVQRIHDGQCAAHYLEHEPEGEKQDRRDLEQEGKEKYGDHHDDSGPREKGVIRTHDPGDGARCPDDGNGRVGIGEHVQEARRDPGEHVEGEKPPGSHDVLYVVSEDPQGPHVEDDMEPSSVEKHAGDEGKVANGGNPMERGPAGMGEPGGNDAENGDDVVEGERGKAIFEKKYESVDPDDEPSHDGRTSPRHVVLDGKHAFPPIRGRDGRLGRVFPFRCTL